LRLSDGEIDALLDDDLRFGDLTMRALGIGERPGRITFAARRKMILCGSEVAARLLARLGAGVTFCAPAGELCAAGDIVLAAEGSAATLHAVWKTAQTLMEWASGVSTSTWEIVEAARSAAPHVSVHCTRKTPPFTRRLAFQAVIAGGGEIHRLGLFDTVMLFDEHRVFLACSVGLEPVIAQLRTKAPERAIMVEVKNEADALSADLAGADVIQLEKFAPDAVRAVVDQLKKRADGRPIVAAAGGINEKNAAEYARAGADVLVTSAPYYARPADIQVQFASD
jgi:molybdenum transport protein